MRLWHSFHLGYRRSRHTSTASATACTPAIQARRYNGAPYQLALSVIRARSSHVVPQLWEDSRFNRRHVSRRLSGNGPPAPKSPRTVTAPQRTAARPAPAFATRPATFPALVTATPSAGASATARRLRPVSNAVMATGPSNPCARIRSGDPGRPSGVDWQVSCSKSGGVLPPPPRWQHCSGSESRPVVRLGWVVRSNATARPYLCSQAPLTGFSTRRRCAPCCAARVLEPRPWGSASWSPWRVPGDARRGRPPNAEGC